MPIFAPPFDHPKKQVQDAIAQKDYYTALFTIHDWLAEYPDHEEAVQFCTDILKRKEISLADPALQGKLKTADADQLSGLGMAFQKADRTRDAIWLYELALQKDPDSQEVLEQLADLYAEQPGDRDKAINHYLQCINIEKAKPDPDPVYLSRIYTAISYTYVEKIDPENAEMYAKLGLEHNVDNYPCYYNLALALQMQEKHQEANDTLNTAWNYATNDSEKGDTQFMLGEVADQLHKPHKARDYFVEALRYDDKMVYAYHNLVTVSRSTSEFGRAVYYAGKALELYEEAYLDNRFEDEKGKCYYYAEMLRDYKPGKTEKDFAKWEELLREYHRAHPEDPDGTGELFKMFFAKKKAIENGEIFADNWHGEWVNHLEDAQSNVVEWYERAVQAFTDYIAKNKRPYQLTYHHVQLGYIYLLFEIYDKAKESFEAALKINPQHAKAMEGMGVAHFKAGEYPKALEYFKKAVNLHPGSLNLECNLADSYRMAGQTEEAERIYQRVLARCPKYLDALAGLGECNKSWGDKEVEAGNTADSEEYFQKARSYFQQVLELRNAANSSKQLTRQELNALYYSLGYSKVRLYEASKGINFGLLLGAKKNLNSVTKSAPEYVKSQKAVRLINQKIFSYSSVLNFAPAIIFLVSFLLLLATQYFMFKKEDKVYQLNRDSILALAKKNSDSTILLKSISPFLMQEFVDLKEIKSKLAPSVQPAFLNMMDMKSVTEKPVGKVIDLDSVSYISLTFGTLLFMIIGLFLPYIAKIKVGAIEMEKNAMETVKATSTIIKK
ncbi:MAG TPA: tetratricopeptide repeat protein [Chitinophagaceae bacterium]|nr:tetratricopeptide repeat protein [Chitinophagaceae bacterium]